MAREKSAETLAIESLLNTSKGEATPFVVVNELQKQGITVDVQKVSNVKQAWKKAQAKEGQPVRHRAAPTRKTQSVVQIANRMAATDVSQQAAPLAARNGEDVYTLEAITEIRAILQKYGAERVIKLAEAIERWGQ